MRIVPLISSARGRRPAVILEASELVPEDGRDPEPSPPPTAPRLGDRLAVAAFLLLFLIPMVLRATVSRDPISFAPNTLKKVQNIACLFTEKPEGWSTYHVQLRFPGDPRWLTVDQAELFPLRPFGRRTRLHRLMTAWRAKEGPRTRDMARWILREYTARHPDEPAPVAIRFTKSWMIPSRDAPPQAGWEHPDWSEVPPGQRRVIASYSRAALEAEESDL